MIELATLIWNQLNFHVTDKMSEIKLKKKNWVTPCILYTHVFLFFFFQFDIFWYLLTAFKKISLCAVHFFCRIIIFPILIFRKIILVFMMIESKRKIGMKRLYRNSIMDNSWDWQSLKLIPLGYDATLHDTKWNFALGRIQILVSHINNKIV